MKAITLNATKSGMTRLRDKGGASPETLYELTNGYVSASKAPKQRPGTRWRYTWPSGTKGMCAFDGKLHSFAAVPTAVSDDVLSAPTILSASYGGTGTIATGTYYYSVTAIDTNGETMGSAEWSIDVTGPAAVIITWSEVVGATGYRVYGRADDAEEFIAEVDSDHLTYQDDGSITPDGDLPAENTTGSASGLFAIHCLRHPSPDFDGEIEKVHYAQPFLGYLYVVAEFDDGKIFHYWLRDPPTWQATHAYLASSSVQPTTHNGYYYQASTDLTPPAWAPSVERAEDDVVQPSVANGWKYTVTATTGDNPISGATEPVWPTTDGATVTEYVEAAPPPPPPSAPPHNPDDPTGGGYNNGSGQHNNNINRPLHVGYYER